MFFAWWSVASQAQHACHTVRCTWDRRRRSAGRNGAQAADTEGAGGWRCGWSYPDSTEGFLGKPERLLSRQHFSPAADDPSSAKKVGKAMCRCWVAVGIKAEGPGRSTTDQARSPETHDLDMHLPQSQTQPGSQVL